MRAYPFQIIAVAALGALAPAAFGAVRPHPARPAAHAVTHAPAKPAKRVVETTRKHGKAEPAEHAGHPLSSTRHGKHAEAVKFEKPSVEKGNRKGKHHQEEEASPVRTKLVHGRRVAIAEPAPRLIARAQRPAPFPLRPAPSTPRPEPLFAPAPTPEPTPELEPIHVNHDRHQHFTSDPALNTQPADEAPHKATTADFLSVGSAPVLPVPAQRAAQAALKAGTILRVSPTAGVVVGAKVDVKPVPLPTLQIAPEPLVSLYDKRGRLVMPKALKGSHEVLVHQNVMADSDGLERIRDDEDLSRMRASRMLVALPENDGIQTDERLPANRRYSRPWTAAFLTAMARSHYARFHTPLQVNSAVRTVEFQQRLIRTNGNAAPAEGETASPHLTGQAVDIAKKGLSLTEVAWLRGYLLPLVQEGKVDVEEEFQQSCFHISVYRKYLPQPAESRKIADTKRLPAAALAVALP